MNDAIPVILIAPIFLGFSFLTYLTSLNFVLLAVALIVMNFVFRHLLEAPTDAGRKVIAELENFKEFLSRADIDRLNREPTRRDPGDSRKVQRLCCGSGCGACVGRRIYGKFIGATAV
jgi:hypothetical protein